MDEFSPILVLFFLWLLIGLPLSKASQAKKKGSAGKRTVSHQAAQAMPPQEPPLSTPPPAAPAVPEHRLVPSVSVTVHDDSVYAGSMNATTGEGFDPCHEEDLAGLNSAESAPALRPAGDAHSLPFGWTGSDMVRGIVVSEILNRKTGRRG